MLAKHLMNSGAAKTYVEEVFSTYTYTGNGSTQTITNGIDLATYGGMVWIKSRSDAQSNTVFNTLRGNTKSLITNTTDAEVTSSGGNDLTGFTASGFSLGPSVAAGVNSSGNNYVSWTYRNAPKFYTHSTKSHTNGVASTVDLSTLGTVGMVRVKRTDSTGSWLVWHRSLTAGNLLIGETTAAQAANTSISVSGTTLNLSSALATGTYLVEAWAHDTSADGLIQCGSFTTDGSGNATVTLGWEAQALIVKRTNAATNWYQYDTARGLPVGSAGAELSPNLSAAEVSGNIYSLAATGFTAQGVGASSPFIYLAIRRGPMKPPTSGTQVYQAIARTGTGAAATVTGVGFPPDLDISFIRDGTAAPAFFDRLRGANKPIFSALINSEFAGANGVTAFGMDGVSLGTDSGEGWVNVSGKPYINWFFRRYPGVFDQVCYTGTGVARTVNHNLGAVPELMIVKKRNANDAWAVYHKDIGARSYVNLNTTSAAIGVGFADGVWNQTAPTASVFTVGDFGPVNDIGATFICHLFASLAGISKVGSYTGNGTSQTIDCGFAAGARFVLIKRTNGSGGDWLLYDSVRGIVAGNDPVLALNLTTSESGMGSFDDVDPVASGFIVNKTPSGWGLNEIGGTYIFLALA
jgi:hypothetical protein